jgi:hypothetical protein
VQAIITTTDPVISIGLGVVWLGVGLRGGPADVSGELASLLLMVAGIVVTARHAPQVTGGPSQLARPRPAARPQIRPAKENLCRSTT